MKETGPSREKNKDANKAFIPKSLTPYFLRYWLPPVFQMLIEFFFKAASSWEDDWYVCGGGGEWEESSYNYTF